MEKQRVYIKIDTRGLQRSKDSHRTPQTARSNLKSALSPTTCIQSATRILKVRRPLSKISSFPKLEKPVQSPKLQSGVFPKWLLERTDFQNHLASTIENDIGIICKKPYHLRNDIENRELLEWSKTFSFFKTFNDSTKADVCSKLKTSFFNTNEVMVREGDIGDKMFIILTGLVGIYNSNGHIDSVGSNNIIGDMALENNTSRNASVIALEPVTALMLTKEDYLNIVIRQRHKQRDLIVNFMKHVEFFKNLLAVRLEVIAWNMIIVTYKDQQVIYSESQHANSIYFIAEGAVKIDINVTVTKRLQIPNKIKETLINKDTYTKSIKTCKQGDFFGEEEVIDKCKRKARAVALGNTELYILKKDILFELLSEKDIKDLMKVHERIPDLEDLRKVVRKTVSDKKLKFKAVLDATNVEPLPSGRKDFDIAMEKKANIVKTLLEVHKKEMSKILLKRESFFVHRKSEQY
ncbi:hypothetical protein SteCoe_14611 [Stentor coeruleus]|uniref:Cyclic nucleotide-binding domain-containing protein n=1 Tax=Stentor coeruleus TaxID=5963 RepID=A0A1R2C5L7_9CILI|nr:hypothetical protein SteCoe_14611 [Stentor coeruleus]